MDKQADYLSYLLRVWRSNGDRITWQASLESPHTSERIGFANLDELFSFLRQQTGEVSNSEAGRKEHWKEGDTY